MRLKEGGAQMNDLTISHIETASAILSQEQIEACPICGAMGNTGKLEAPDRFHLKKIKYRLVRCLSCSGIWLASPPKPEEMDQHYTEDYHRGIAAAGEGRATSRWRNQVKLISKHKKEGAILDIGCSSGGFLSTMKGPSWNLYGIEMEYSTAERARTQTGADVFVGDALFAPFPSASFDVITAFDVLEHVYSPREFLSKVYEWLKPGGIFYAMMPNIESWEARLFGSYWYGLELPRHLTHFSPKSLEHIMTEIGFERVLIKTPAISYVEQSMGYLCSSLLEAIGISPTPQSRPVSRSIPWRAIRKMFRLFLFEPMAMIGSIAKVGPSLEVVFRKPVACSQSHPA
jgi:SAM-dependent methyltransferase